MELKITQPLTLYLDKYLRIKYAKKLLSLNVRNFESNNPTPDLIVQKGFLFIPDNYSTRKSFEKYLSNISSFVFESKYNRMISKIEYSNLLNDLETVDSKSLSYFSWFGLYYITTDHGLYQLGNICRDKMRERAHSDWVAKKLPIHYFRNWRADLENVDSDLVLKKPILTSKSKRDFYERALIYNYLMVGRRDEAIGLAKSFYQSQDKRFADLIRGKSIAIVGPATGDIDLWDEISQFDLIIRLNYRGELNQQVNHQTRRLIDISYFSKQDTLLMESTGHFQTLKKDLQFSVFKSQQNNFVRSQINEADDVRSLFSFNDFLHSGSMNMIQTTLLDLLCFETGAIKIFNTNLFLSQSLDKMYSNNYSTPNPVSYRSVLFAYHDLATNFNVLKKLFVKGLSQADDELQSVLKLNTMKYLEGIEKLFTPSLAYKRDSIS